MSEYPPSDEESVAADEVIKVMDAFSEQGIQLKLAHMTEADKLKLPSIQEIIPLLGRNRVDIIRVDVALLLVAEAAEIHRNWASFMDFRTLANSRRYADLLFSARAMLPPAFPWERVTYLHLSKPVKWTHQLAYDPDGQVITGATYDTPSAKALMAKHKVEG